eukprot:jgi/Hompol1/5701/HPOL_004639-RA
MKLIWIPIFVTGLAAGLGLGLGLGHEPEREPKSKQEQQVAHKNNHNPDPLTASSATRSAATELPSLPSFEELRTKPPQLIEICGVIVFLAMIVGGMVVPPLVFIVTFVALPWTRVLHCLYALWMAIDADTPNNGGWNLSLDARAAFAALPAWRWLRNYFPALLVQTAPVDPSTNYILAYHPHGVYCLSLFTGILFNPDWYSKFGLIPRGTTLPINFRIPLWRELCNINGTISCDRAAIHSVLTKKPAPGQPGTCVAIVIGGGEEFWHMKSGSMDLVLKKRLGFVKMALQTGASLLPTIGFGENELFTRLQHPIFDPLHRLTYKMAKMAAPLFVGRYLTLLPHRRPLITVGKPLNPSLQLSVCFEALRPHADPYSSLMPSLLYITNA